MGASAPGCACHVTLTLHHRLLCDVWSHDAACPGVWPLRQLFLLTYEFPEMVAVATSNSLTVLTSAKKGTCPVCVYPMLTLWEGVHRSVVRGCDRCVLRAGGGVGEVTASLVPPRAVSYLDPCVEACAKSAVKLRVLARNAADGDDANFQSLLEVVRGSGSSPKLGFIARENPEGQFIRDWRSKVHGSGIPSVDSSLGIDNALAAKSGDELVRRIGCCYPTARDFAG